MALMKRCDWLFSIGYKIRPSLSQLYYIFGTIVKLDKKSYEFDESTKNPIKKWQQLLVK